MQHYSTTKKGEAENRIPVHCTGCARVVWMTDDVAAERIRRKRARCDICGAPQGFPSSMTFVAEPVGEGKEPDTVIFEKPPPAAVQQQLAALRAEERASGTKLLSSDAMVMSKADKFAVSMSTAAMTSILTVGMQQVFGMGPLTLLTLIGAPVPLLLFNVRLFRRLRGG